MTRGSLRYLIPAAMLLLAAGLPTHAPAEEPQPPEGDTSRIEKLKQALEADQGKQKIEPAPILLPPEQLDPETLHAMQRSIRAYYDYRFHGFEHRKAVFAWQLLSSRIIFGIVVLLVGVGIYFSWIQFTAGMRAKPGPPSGAAAAKAADESADHPAPPASSVTTFEASKAGIKVSSPVLGVILLVISLAFFYLYLVYVYPIEEIF